MAREYRLYLSLAIIFVVFLSSCATARTHFMDSLNLNQLKDGLYIGQDTTPLCGVKLATTVREHKIDQIKILSHFVTYPLAGRAYDIIPKRIVQKQSLDVDAVTAATVSSNNIKKAVFNALLASKMKGDILKWQKR